MSDAFSLYETASRIAAVADAPEEFQAAATLMRQAAELGYSRAMNAWGTMLMGGRGVERDPQEAFRQWSMAALDYGESECAFKLGLACRDGGDHGSDRAGAMAWFMLARDLGLDLAALDVDDVTFEMIDSERIDGFARYDRLRENCVLLR
jgi:TPR repeat protein